MPAKDVYHDAVVNALRKDGWIVRTKQLYLTIENRSVWIDIEAEKSQQVIVVEVKGFEDLSSPISYLHVVVGQYVVYREILKYLELNHDLYLAVREEAYNGILQEKLAEIIIKNIGIKILVFDNISEVIVSWIT